MKRGTKRVYLAFTRNNVLAGPQLLKVYMASHYQDAFNWLADLAERHGNREAPMCGKYVIPGPSESEVVALTVNPNNGQRWWLECHQVF